MGENRVLVPAGLERLSATHRAGLVALKEVAGCPASIGTYEAGFQLAPRLNAAGRLEDAGAALQLLLTRDPVEAGRLATQLDGNNRQRREIERTVCNEIVQRVRARFDAQEHYVIIEGHADWHIGVVGIVASRVSRRSFTGRRSSSAATARFGAVQAAASKVLISPPPCAIAMNCYSDMAATPWRRASASIPKKSIPSARASMILPGRACVPEQLQPCLKLDAEVALSELTVAQVEELARLEPMGQGNPAVRLVLRGVSHARAAADDGPGQSARQTLPHRRPPNPGCRLVERRRTPPGRKIDLTSPSLPKSTITRAGASVQLKLLDWRPAPVRSLPPRRRDERLQFFHQTREAVQRQLLRAVAPGLGRIGMDFDQQPVGAHRHRALAHGHHQVGPPRALARINDDRAMRFLLDDRNGRKVQRVARVSFKRADAALAKHQIGIVVRQNVFARQQPFLDLHGKAALEQDRLAGLGGGDEQLKILRVARANLNDVRVFGHQFGVLLGKQFGDDRQPRFAARLGQKLQSLDAQPWNSYGEVRGLNAPPRRIVAPAFLTACAVWSNCRSSSTEHGPAMT